MCIVVDANSISHVFRTSDIQHNEFKPVFNWIVFGKGKLVMGGSKYKNEVYTKMKSFTGLLLQLRNVHKIVYFDDESVDFQKKRIDKLYKAADFDDSHIIALLDISKCKLLCTLDTGLSKYAQMPKFYRHPHHKISIYSSRSNQNLLIERNIATCCSVCKKLNAKDRTSVTNALLK